MVDSSSSSEFNAFPRNQRPLLQIPSWQHQRDHQDEAADHQSNTHGLISSYISKNSASLVFLDEIIW